MEKPKVFARGQDMTISISRCVTEIDGIFKKKTETICFATCLLD